MRFKDGLIQETDLGLYIRLENDTLAFCAIVSWTSLFYLSDQKLINSIITSKISEMQYEFALYTYDKEAADDPD